MSSNKTDRFIEQVIGEYGPVPEFRPHAYYDEAGDCIEFLFSNEPFFARRLDGWVTVYLSEATQEVVGGLINGVRSLLERYPGLRIDIEGRELAVACLLRAPAYSVGDELKQTTYKAIIRKAEKADMRAELNAA